MSGYTRAKCAKEPCLKRSQERNKAVIPSSLGGDYIAYLCDEHFKQYTDAKQQERLSAAVQSIQSTLAEHGIPTIVVSMDDL